jgi:hypothetical protein
MGTNISEEHSVICGRRDTCLIAGGSTFLFMAMTTSDLINMDLLINPKIRITLYFLDDLRCDF